VADLVLRAGSAIITPSEPGELAGYIARAGAVSTGTHDELEASLLVLEDGSTEIAWLTLDAIGATADLVAVLQAAVRASVGESATTIVAASHSHSAPLGWTGGIHPGNPGARSESAVAELVARIASLAESVGRQGRRVVTASWSSDRVPGVGTNRLSPDGPHDDTVGVLTLRDADGPAAVLFDFATHPTVLGPGNLTWSADWPGAARRALPAGVVAGFLQGAAGDVSSRFTRRGDGFDEVDRLGGIVGDAVSAAARRSGMPLTSPIRVASSTLVVPRRSLPSVADAERAVVTAAEALAGLGGSPLDPEVRLAQTRNEGARVQRDLAAAQLPDAFELSLTAVAVGDVAWLHVPLELFASVGARIQDASPYPVTRVIGYANGYVGYLADAAAHAAGSYEALSTFFPADAADDLVAAAADLLARTRHTLTEAAS
jgi:hypothetical protein